MSDPTFDKEFWDQHWLGKEGGAMSTSPPNPHLVREVGALRRGTALDAGCGAGAEAVWLAAHGWRVTGADLATDALQRAAARMPADVAERLTWLEADLTTWTPEQPFDLVTTHYAHPTIPQLAFYERLGEWVAPGGSLLVVAHGAGEHAHGHGHGHEARGHGDGHPSGHGHAKDQDHADSAHGHSRDAPAQPVVTAEAICARFGPERWEVVTAGEVTRAFPRPGRPDMTLDDVVVRLRRKGSRG